MTIIARVLSRAFSETSDRTKNALLKHLVLFCAAVLLVAVMALTYGTDLSLAFF
jgi:hypothetical protein